MKNKTMAYAVLAILLAVFNVVMFSVPVEKSTVFWLSYAFTTLAFLVQIGVCTVAFGKAHTMKSKFLGFPIFYVGYMYLAVQILAYIIFTVLAGTAPVWAALITYTIILGFTLICLIVVDVARDEINRVEEKVKGKVFYIKNIQTDMELLTERVSQEPLKSKLKALVDTIKYSDPMSNDALTTLEGDIEVKTIELKQAVTANSESAVSLIDEINLLLAERNKKNKLLK
jgi:hypothetical protein